MRNRQESHSNSKRALIVAYHYPPITSGGVERTLKFIQYLPEFGYEATVLTTSAFGQFPLNDHVLRAWEPLGLYRYLFNRISSDDRQQYSSTRTISPISKPIQWLRRWLFVPDGQIMWLPVALVKALNFVRNNDACVIYTTSPPASAHLIGLVLQRYTDLPWVADFRDSWTYDPLDPELASMPRRLKLERRMEECVVNCADSVVTTTEASADYLTTAYPDMKKTVDLISNGFDPSETNANSIPTKLKHGIIRKDGSLDPMLVVHTGSFAASHPHRSPETLFQAFESLLNEDETWRERIHLLLVGNLTPHERSAAASLVCAGVVEIRSEVNRILALEFQRQADVLVLVDHPRNWPSSNLPGKFFEYAATGNPILSLCGDGMVAKFMNRLQSGICVSPEDAAAISRALKQFYYNHRSGIAQGADPIHLRPFHRRELTRKLATCFDRAIQTH